MLAKCANPICGAHFLYLKQGRIFNVPVYCADYPSRTAPQRVEHFWLCSNCCTTLTLTWRDGQAVVQARYRLLTEGGGPGSTPARPKTAAA